MPYTTYRILVVLIENLTLVSVIYYEFPLNLQNMYNKLKYLALSTIVIYCLVLLSGCYKLKDYLHNHGDADFKICNIKKIASYSSTDTITWVFTYNSSGNPISVIGSFPYTSNPNYTFFYDKHERLIQFVSPYTNGYYDQWSRYGYNNKGQIVIDTNYAFGIFAGPNPLPSPYLTITYYDYDALGRIIHTKDVHYSQEVYITTTEKFYNYDANGNLSDGSVYDNKLNAHRTNAIWMFLKKDYSLNNPFIATQYNEYNLPVICPRTDIVSAFSGNVKIDYLCN